MPGDIERLVLSQDGSNLRGHIVVDALGLLNLRSSA